MATLVHRFSISLTSNDSPSKNSVTVSFSTWFRFNKTVLFQIHGNLVLDKCYDLFLREPKLTSKSYSFLATYTSCYSSKQTLIYLQVQLDKKTLGLRWEILFVRLGTNGYCSLIISPQPIATLLTLS